MAQNSPVKKRIPLNRLVSKLGFWSSAIATLLVLIATVAIVASFVGFPDALTLQMAMWLLLAPTFVVMMVSIHYYASDDKKILSYLGVVFAVAYMVIVGFNYFTQLTVVRFAGVYGPIEGVGLFAFENTHSLLWALEALGYGFMCLATFFAAPVFTGGWLERSICWLFIANSILGAVGAVFFVLDIDWRIMVAGFALWNIKYSRFQLLY